MPESGKVCSNCNLYGYWDDNPKCPMCRGFAAEGDSGCCICGADYGRYGHNPDPVKSSGRCCDTCNATVVIPARISMIRMSSEYESEMASEGNTPIMPPMDFGEMVNWRPHEGDPSLKRQRAEGVSEEVTIRLQRLAIGFTGMTVLFTTLGAAFGFLIGRKMK